MELSERKQQILRAIIGDYIRTAEPVGSKALTAHPELPFSSATIRNEMSELEELGLIEKPHTSAGRIPSPKGYRFYVDALTQLEDLDLDDMDTAQIAKMMHGKVKELDYLIREAGKLISSLTDYASVAVTPKMTQTSIRQFEIIPIDKQTFVIVLVIQSGAIKNKMVRTMADVSREEAELLTYVLNETLTTIPISQITPHKFDIVRRAAGLTALLAPLAEYIAELMEDLDNQKVYLDGTSKLLRYPEYRDHRKAQALLDYLDEDSHLIPVKQQVDGIQIFIGPENGENPLSEATTMYAKYDIGDYGYGVVGLVGPTRMDYGALSKKLSRFAKGLNKLIADTFLSDEQT